MRSCMTRLGIVVSALAVCSLAVPPAYAAAESPWPAWLQWVHQALTGETGSNLTGETGSNLTGETGSNLTGETGSNLTGETGSNLAAGETGSNCTGETGSN